MSESVTAAQAGLPPDKVHAIFSNIAVVAPDLLAFPTERSEPLAVAGIGEQGVG